METSRLSIRVVGVLGLILLGSQMGAQAPSNDLCSGAATIFCNQTVTGSTANATADMAGQDCLGSITAPGVWYKINPIGSVYTVDLCGSSFDTQVFVFRGDCNNLECVASNDNNCWLNARVTWVNTESETFYVYITGAGTETGEYEFSLGCSGCFNGAPPPNDSCEDAIVLETGVEEQWWTCCADEAAPTPCLTYAIPYGVWFRFNSLTYADVTFEMDANGSNPLALLIYKETGLGCESLEPLVCAGPVTTPIAGALDPIGVLESETEYYFFVYTVEPQFCSQFLIQINGELGGCTNPVACNYDPVATTDDGSCTFPELYYDCAGNCLNDADQDGICDEFELPCPGQGCCGEGTLWDPFLLQCFPHDECPADINGDGAVDALDVLGLIENYGVPCPDSE